MTLTFLGQKYEAATIAAVIPIESELTGQYRGSQVTFSRARSTNPNMVLTYRGLRYTR